jgi:Fic family protein
MTIEQITNLINNKRVLASKKDILEVKNAFEVYSKLDDFNTYSLDSLCRVHGILMKDLIKNAGNLRHNKEISSATAIRDLKEAVSNVTLEKIGDKRLTKYRFI